MVIDGSMSMDELEELLGFVPEDSDKVETAGGLVLMLMDRIPEAGDSVRMEHRTATKKVSVLLTVLEMDRFRVDKIAVDITEEMVEE